MMMMKLIFARMASYRKDICPRGASSCSLVAWGRIGEKFSLNLKSKITGATPITAQLGLGGRYY